MRTSLKSLAAVAAALVSVSLLSGCGGGDSGDDYSGEDYSTSEDSDAEVADGDEGTDDEEMYDELDPTFADGVYTAHRYTITVTDHRVIAPGEAGNESGTDPVIAFWYDMANTQAADDPHLADVDPSEFTWVLTALQGDDSDPAAELTEAPHPDAALEATATTGIEPGATQRNAVAYVLNDATTPVELVAVDYGDNEIGRTTYSLQ